MFKTKSFSNAVVGYFVARPNRFVVLAELEDGTSISAHCPNPGRLIELTIPGQKMFFTKDDSPGRKHKYTLVAAEYKGKILPLYSVKANKIAEELIIPHIFSGNYEVFREVTRGSSRFDLMVKQDDKEHLIEVKACTLSEYTVSAFPDAPSERAARHIKELAQFPDSHVIWILFHEDAEYFTPNFHTDQNFSKTFWDFQNRVHYHCASVSTDLKGLTKLVNFPIPILNKGQDYITKQQATYIVHFEKDTNHYLYLHYVDSKADQYVKDLGRKNKRLPFPPQLEEFSSKIAKGRVHYIFGESFDLNLKNSNIIFKEDNKTLLKFTSNPFKDRDFLDQFFKYRYLNLRPGFSE